MDRDAQRQRTDDNDMSPQRNDNGTMTIFGINVTNVSRTFTPQEFTDLGTRGRKYVQDKRHHRGSEQTPARWGQNCCGRG